MASAVSRSDDQSAPDFVLEFAHHGSRIPAKDQAGNEVFHLWRIRDKCTVSANDRVAHYQIQFWENSDGKNLVHTRRADEVKKYFPAEVAQWEAKFGAAWDTEYGMRGNVCNPASFEPTPGKRPFADTPQKDRQQMKKVKVSVREVSSDEDEDDEGGVPLLPQPVLRSNDDDDIDSPVHAGTSQVRSRSDPFSNASKTASSAFMPPPPVPARSRVLASHPSRRFLNPGQSLGLKSNASTSKMELDSPDSSPRRPASKPSLVDDSDSDETPPRARPIGRPRASLLSTSSPSRRTHGANSSHRLVAQNVMGSPQRRQASQVSDAEVDVEDGGTPTPRQDLKRRLLLRRRLALQDSDEDDLPADYSQKVEASLKAAYEESQRELEEDLQASQAQASQISLASVIPTATQPMPLISAPNLAAPVQVTPAIPSAKGPASAQPKPAPSFRTVPVVLIPVRAAPRPPPVHQAAPIPPVSLVPQVSKYNEYSQKLIAAHAKGLGYLLRTALNLTEMPCDIWVRRRRASTQCNFKDFFVELLYMIIGIEGSILERFVKGDLPKADREDANIRKLLRQLKNMTADDKIPAIYAQYLNDYDGISPTAAMLLQMLDTIELYIRGFQTMDQASADVAFKIDQAMGKPTTLTACGQGERKYIESVTQAATCLEWVRRTRDRLTCLPPNQALERPFVEVGYATKPVERLAQHKKHTSSNYNMNLSEAACKVLFKGKYFISQYVIMHIVDHTHAMYAEIILSRFALAYINQGGGFSHCMAGSSNAGVNTLGQPYWTKVRNEVSAEKSFLAKVKAEIEKEKERTQQFSSFKAFSDDQNHIIRDSMYIMLSSEIVEETVRVGKTQVEECLRETDGLIELLELEEEDEDGDGLMIRM
jgi:hypothetical protein